MCLLSFQQTCMQTDTHEVLFYIIIDYIFHVIPTFSDAVSSYSDGCFVTGFPASPIAAAVTNEGDFVGASGKLNPYKIRR